MRDEARAFWVTAPGHGEIRSEPIGTAADGDIVVQALFSGISRGTESLVFNGQVPRSEWQRMRAPFQAGEFPGPVKYGYSMVGRVVGGPPALRERTVFVLYPHQTHFIIPAAAAYVVPDDVPAGRAVLAANLETALNGVWDARPHVGDRISVIGAGTVGVLAAWLASRIGGCDVELIDVQPARATVARALGVRFAEPSSARRDADVVIHASGSAAGLETALQLAGNDATVVELSWYGEQVVPVPLGAAFHSRRLTIMSSQVGRVAVSQRTRWDARRRMQLVLDLLRDPALDALITGEAPFERLPDVMAALARSPGNTLCHRIRYQEIRD